MRTHLNVIMRTHLNVIMRTGRSQWPSGLRRGSGIAGSNPAGGMDVCLL